MRGLVRCSSRGGQAISASNWNRPDSFVGSNYAFREYFTGALAQGTAEHYALGNVSRRPGLYLSRRIEDETGLALGVVVVKVEFGIARKFEGVCFDLNRIIDTKNFI